MGKDEEELNITGLGYITVAIGIKEKRIYKAMVDFKATHFSLDELFDINKLALKRGMKTLAYPYKAEIKKKGIKRIHLWIPYVCSREELYKALYEDPDKVLSENHREPMDIIENNKNYMVETDGDTVNVDHGISVWGRKHEDDSDTLYLHRIVLNQIDPEEHPFAIQVQLIAAYTDRCASLRFQDYFYNKVNGRWEYHLAVDDDDRVTMEYCEKYVSRLTDEEIYRLRVEENGGKALLRLV
jgi:hypothetical protein